MPANILDSQLEISALKAIKTTKVNLRFFLTKPYKG